jgi:hypothetical protein
MHKDSSFAHSERGNKSVGKRKAMPRLESSGGK